MDQYIFDESNGLWYELQGDYYIPCLLISKIKKYRQWQFIALFIKTIDGISCFTI